MPRPRKLHTSLSLAAVAVVLLAPGYRPKAGPGPESVTFVFERDLDGFMAFEDTTIFSESQNSGGGTNGIFSGTILGGTDHRRALLWVDVSVIPEGAVIEEVTLELFVDRSGGNFGNIDYTLHALLKDWGEGDRVGGSGGGQGAPAAPGDATWLSNFHQMELWANPGGDFDPEASAIGTAGPERTFAVWTGPGLVADVQRWVDDPSTNFGWILISTQEGVSQRVKRFSSSEATTNRPRLTVVATLPAGEGEGEGEGGTEGEGEGEGGTEGEGEGGTEGEGEGEGEGGTEGEGEGEGGAEGEGEGGTEGEGEGEGGTEGEGEGEGGAEGEGEGEGGAEGEGEGEGPGGPACLPRTRRIG